MPLAGPCIGDSAKSHALQDGSTGGERVNQEVARAEIGRLTRPGRDQGAVVTATTVRGESSAAVEPRKQAVGVRVEPANADRFSLGVGDVAAMLFTTRAQGVGQSVAGEVIISCENGLRD